MLEARRWPREEQPGSAAPCSRTTPACEKCHSETTPGAHFCGTCGTHLPIPASDGAADPFLGQTLNGVYSIQQKIGSGGMGEVYRALHLNLEAPVALKIMKRGLLADPGMVHRLHREARAASRLRHPNVISVRDFGQTEDGTLFMVMEYVTGKTLAQVIAEESPLPEHRVVHIGAQILSALAEAHANQILHRDLKPPNVMIETRRDASDSVKVLDFGIAKILTVGQGASTLTQAGLVCGTPGYMSPEQLRGGDIDGRSDIYAMAVILYVMLTGRLPFEVQTPMEMLHKQLSEALVPPSVRRAEPMSSGLEALVMRALSPRREDRPGSAEEMRDELLTRTRDKPPLTGGAATRLPSGEAEGRGTSRTTPAPRPSGSEAQRHKPPGVGPASAATTKVASSPLASPAPITTEPTPGASAIAGYSSAAATTALERAVLERIERRASSFLGQPIARHLLKRLGWNARTPADLCQKLAAYIPSGEDRKAFLAASHADTNAPSSASVLTASRETTGIAWDPALLERARRDLAVHVGPLARLVVQRVCPRARSPEELYELLSLAIPSEADRERFLRSAPRPGDE